MKLYNKSMSKMLLGAGMLLAGMTACTDDLDITPDGRLDLPAVWESADYTEAFFSSCFDHIPNKHVNYYWFDNLPSGLSDESWSCDDVEGVGPILAYKGQGSAEDNLFEHHYLDGFDDQYWSKYWPAIRQINTFLENIPTAAAHSESKRNAMIGEAKILRAYYYLQLVKWYGDIPIILEVPDIYSDFSEYSREPAWKVLQQCVADCEDAMRNADVSWRIANLSERNRMTKAIACAIISQASLYAASPLYCKDQNLWNYAYEKNKYAYQQLKDNGYSLYMGKTFDDGTYGKPYDENYNSAYGEMFVASPGYPTECERIMVDRPERPNQPSYWVWGMPIQSNYRAGLVPSQELVDSYDMLEDGKPILDYRQPYLDEQHLEPNINPESCYSASNPFRGRDLRFEATVIHHGSTVYVGDQASTVDVSAGGNCEIRDDMRTNTRTGYYNNKYRQWYSCAAKRSGDGKWIYYRFAEVMLNLAEAAIEVGTTDKINEAMVLINEVRHRAGHKPANDLNPAGDQELARLMLRKERRVEFVFEEHRFFDCRRWTLNNQDIECERYTTGMRVIKRGIRNSYERFLVGEKLSHKAKWHFLPIPLKEANTLAEKTGQNWQNYGW